MTFVQLNPNEWPQHVVVAFFSLIHSTYNRIEGNRIALVVPHCKNVQNYSTMSHNKEKKNVNLKNKIREKRERKTFLDSHGQFYFFSKLFSYI